MQASATQPHRALTLSGSTTFQQANSAKPYRFFFGCVQVLDFDQFLAIQSGSKHDAASVRYMVNFTLYRIFSCLKHKTTTYCPVRNKYQGKNPILRLVALTSTHFRAGLIFINFTSLYALLWEIIIRIMQRDVGAVTHTVKPFSKY